MNAGSANWNWPEVEGVLAAMSSDEEVPIVCGGQAVSFWAQRFGLHPVVSQDLDILFCPPLGRPIPGRARASTYYRVTPPLNVGETPKGCTSSRQRG